MPSLLASAHRTASPPAVIFCHEAQSLQRRCVLPLRPTQFPVYAYVLSFTFLLLSKRQHLVRAVDYSLPDRDSHPARGTKLRLAHTMSVRESRHMTGTTAVPDKVPSSGILVGRFEACQQQPQGTQHALPRIKPPFQRGQTLDRARLGASPA